MSALIKTKNLNRFFGSGENKTHVLKNIDLEIHSGEMVAIIGQSGSGKSTLMNILACLDKASAGEYYWQGRKIESLSDDERAKLRRESIGFIFQRYHLLPNLSAEENVAIPAIYAGAEKNDYSQRAQDLLSRLGLEKRLKNRPNQLSGGQQQRVSIARSLMNGGEVIFADEPTGALDSQSGAEVMQILRELNQNGHTIILVTHDREIAEQAQRIIELKDGEIIADSRKEALPDKKLILKNKYQNSGLTRFFNAFNTAWRAIFAHKLRSFLTMLGIIIGIASVVAVLALGEGSKQKILSDISYLGSNTIEIFPGKFGERRNYTIHTLNTVDAEVLQQQSFVDSVTPVVNFSTVLRYKNQSINTNIYGVGEQFFQVQNFPLQTGRFLMKHDINNYAALGILDKGSAEKLFKNENPLGKIVVLRNVPVKIIGVVDISKSQRYNSSNNLKIFMPYNSVMKRLSGRSHLSSITVRIKDEIKTQAAEEAISKILIRRHGREDFSLFNSESFREVITKTTQSLSLLVSAIAGITLLVGGIGVMNIMLVSVSERTQEIGIRMAVGARKSDILWQFLIEAVLICLIGAVLGIAFAFAFGYGIEKVQNLFVLIYSKESIILSVFCATTIGLIFGFLPARKAANLNPIEALARE